jgi:hypothetical protein
LEKTRVALLYDVGQLEEEDRCLAEYRRELELLQQVLYMELIRHFSCRVHCLKTMSNLDLENGVAYQTMLGVRWGGGGKLLVHLLYATVGRIVI